MLLYHIPGTQCFADMRTVDGTVYPTYQQAAEALGLLESDNQWEQCMAEAAVFRSAHSLRNHFCTILAFCFPTNPFALFSKFKDEMSDDYLLKLQINESIDSALVDIVKVSHDHCLFDLNETLCGQFSIDLRSYHGFQIPDEDTRSDIAYDTTIPLPVREQRRLIVIAQRRQDDANESHFNEDQLLAYQAIITAYRQPDMNTSEGRLFFVDGPGGTDKTFLFNALLHKVRKDGGRTAHSAFKIPLQVDGTSMCSIKPNSEIALLLRLTELIIWDEASMMNREEYEAVDRTFRDVLKVKDTTLSRIPFGGCLFVFGGDFRQILPVILKGSRSDIVKSCLDTSYLWQHITVLKLRLNMPVRQALNSENSNLAQQLQSFADYLLDVGNGKVETVSINTYLGPSKTDLIKLPEARVVPGNNLINLLKIELFGPKEEFKKEIEVLSEQLKYLRTQMKLGG
ncbi:hypothetical protein A0J61_10728, partial [Choanephora cucurbitarum]